MRSVNSHVRTILLLAAAGSAGLGGCAADGEPDTGTVSLNLVGQAPSGTIYRLRDAVVTVTGPGSTQVFNTEDDPNRTSLSANVATGDYAALLSPGFRVERIQGMSATTVDAELITPNPATFTVFAEQRTTVPLRFRVAAEDVDMAQGYDIVLEIEEVSAGSLVVTNFFPPSSGPSIEVFAAGANGDVPALRTIGGPSSTLQNARGIAVVNNELIVVDQSGNAVDVFPLGASGDVAPLRRIAGSLTGLSTPSGILVFNGEIYVSQQSNTVVVFPLTATGNVAPTRTITGIGQGQYVAIDQGELYVSDFAGSAPGVIRVYPVNASGAATPTRVISLGVAPTGILIRDGELFVAENNGTILVFAETASGAPAPLRTIVPSTSLGFIDQLSISQGELYVASFSFNAVAVFPTNANGAVTPTRTISGPSTQLNGPVGTFVF